MKTNANNFSACMLCLCICATLNAKAQQPQDARVADKSEVTAMQKDFNSNYTYHIFQTPNKMYGYDIFKNGKGIFHQPASIVQSANPALAKANSPNSPFYEKQTPQNVILSKKGDAQNAALLSIEKLKKQMPPALTEEEIKKIIP